MAGFLAVLLGMFGVNSLALREANTAVGLLCGILSAAMYAVMVIFNKKAKSITGLENSMWQLLAGFLTVNAKALGVGTRDYARWRSSAGARLAAAIGSHGVAAHGRDRLPKPSVTRWRAASTKTRGTASGPAPGPAPKDGSRGPSGSGKKSSRNGTDARDVGWGARAG
jgi:hypothetical protein